MLSLAAGLYRQPAKLGVTMESRLPVIYQVAAEGLHEFELTWPSGPFHST